MPTPPTQRIPDEARVFSPGQYAKVALGIGLAVALVALPAAIDDPHATLGREVGRFGKVLFIMEAQLWFSYALRYGRNPLRWGLSRQPQWRNRAGRLLLTLAFGLGLGALNYWLELRTDTGLHYNSWFRVLANSAFIAGFVFMLQMGLEAVERAQHLSLENEVLKRAQLLARFEGLKQQLSPHFLFNSLSTLGGLIDDDPAAAHRFVEEMAQVYRYLLRHGEQDEVPLREELAFLRSYCYLLQMRFGESLALTIDLPEAVLDRRVPPLALQTLVENAVKHNVVSRAHPLRIAIGLSAAGALLVRNSRHARRTPVASNGVGLSNLSSRLQLLHQGGLLVEADPTEFRVHLRLPA